ncbi:MAG: dihydrolipoyl dehydrogenase [Alphaproteobacteria bacterium]
MSDTKFDVIILGGGPGGYVTAIRAAQLKLKVAVVELENLGGICLNWGCIPTKALLRSAEIYRNMKHADAYGLKADGAGFDMPQIIKRSRQVAGQLSKGVQHLLKKNKVTVIMGRGKLVKGAGNLKTIEIAQQDGKISAISAKDIILATGARAREIPGLEADGKLVWSYRHALVADHAPKRLLVIGSGAIGIEFASFFNEFGSKVTVVEVMDRILPVEDAEISKMADKSFAKQGMEILTKSGVKSLERHKDHVTASLEINGKIEKRDFDRVISAVGIVGNVEDLGLESLGIKVEKTHIAVNEWSQTNIAGIYAIGDVAGPPWLAHKAEHEGVICIEKIAGVKGVHPLNFKNIPGCTYSNPQVASVGMSEEKAKQAGHQIKVGRFPFMGNGKAIALGEPEGMVKTIFDAKTGELLGAHMIGAEVTELIQGYNIARTLETTEADLMHTIFPHPTLSEMMHESVLDAFDRVIHM